MTFKFCNLVLKFETKLPTVDHDRLGCRTRCRPANGLSSNGFNGLGFDMDGVWVDSNGLYYLMGWGGVSSI